MESICGKVLKSVFILPYFAGNHRRQQHGFWRYDCTISSRVLFLIIVALVIVFTASKKIKTHDDIRLGIVLLLLSILMVCSMFGMARLGCVIRKHGLESIVSERRHTSTPKLQMIFLWGFGLGSGLYCSLFLGKQIECTAYSSGNIYWVLLLIFDIMLILSIFTEMISLSYLSPFQLKQRTDVNCPLFLLLTGNISVLLYIYLMKDTFIYAMEIYPERHFASCIKTNSTVTLLLHKSQHFLSPTFLEFALLAITVLLEIWSPTVDHHAGYRPTCTGINDRGSSERSSVIVDADNDPSEQTSLLHSVTSDESQQAHCQHATINHHHHSENGKISKTITLVGSLTAGLGMIVCYAAEAMELNTIENIRYATEIYELALIVVMVLAFFLGFFCLEHYCTPESPPKPLRPGDYVYLLSAFGTIMLHFYQALGGDISSNKSANIFLSKSIASLLHDYLQTVFLLQANRCKKLRPSVDLLESIFVFSMIMNLAFWFTNSFLIAEFPSTHILEHVNFSKELLDLLYKVLLPVTVFFRFTSFLEFYAIWSEYK